MTLTKLRPTLIACFLLLSGACHDSSSSSGGGGTGAATSTYSADVATAWFNLLTATIDAENLNPPEASRRIGYAGVALYEAVVNGMPEHLSLGGQLNGLGALPALAAGTYYWPAVANAALSAVLADLFAGATQPTTLPDIASLEAQLEAQFALDTDQATLDRSIDHGAALAAAISAWIATDGYTQWNDCPYTPPVGDGLWVQTSPATALEPCWGNLRPFVLLFGAECAPLPPPPFSRAVGSSFEIEAREVYDTVNGLTPEQQAIASFWGDGGGTLTPPGHWISITGQVIDQEALALDVAAEAYAKVAIGVADAFISCWEIKYTYCLLRPITYIHDPAGPINDPAWTTAPGIGTPPFPEFTSGHSTQSGTAAFLLADLLGDDIAFTDHTHDAVPLPARSFDSFTAAASEAAISRLYGGIHYRSAIERGLEQGRCIGHVILQNVQFRQ